MAANRTGVRDVEIEWEAHGEGRRTLLLVHGFTGARTDFESHFAELARDRRVVAADHRGHGGSTNTGDPATYTLEVLADDLIGFLEAEVDGPVDMLGHSMGGMITLRLALRRPDLVRSLILMDTAAEPPGGPVPDNLRDLVEEHGLRRVIEFAAQTPERELFAQTKGAQWVESDAERRLTAMDPEAFLALLPQVFQCENLVPRLGEIRCPTTVLVGSRDTPFVQPSRTMADAIEGAQLAVVDGAYHSPQHTHPDEWRARVRAHLDRADASAASA